MRFVESMADVDFEGVVVSMRRHSIRSEGDPLFYVISMNKDPEVVDCLRRKVQWIIEGTCCSGFQQEQLGNVGVFSMADFTSYKTRHEFAFEPVTVLLEKGPQNLLATHMPGTILNNDLN